MPRSRLPAARAGYGLGPGRLGLAALVSAASVLACGELPEADLGVCGNRVFEPEFGEDCDGSAASFGPDAKCGLPTSSTPCRLTCNAQAEASGCPPGWGCGTDGVCRKPTAEIEIGSLPGLARAVGDLDGDGRDDIILRGPGGEAQVAFFTEGRNLAELFVDPARRPISETPRVEPVITRLTTDAVDDLALPLIRDDIVVRAFVGGPSRALTNPFVELVTVPFGASEVAVQTAFNPLGLPQAVCAVGGCSESLLLSKIEVVENRYAVLIDRQLHELFRLADGTIQQSAGLATWVDSLPCDVLAVSYRAQAPSSPANTVEFFPLCKGVGQLNKTDPISAVEPVASVSLSEADPSESLIIAGTGDIDGDGRPDLLLNATHNSSALEDDPRTYALYGASGGHFTSAPDGQGLVDQADRSAPLILAHSWSTSTDPSLYIEAATWPRAMADINGDGRGDYLLTAGVVALSTADPDAVCQLAGETILAGPPVGGDQEPAWGYACVLIDGSGLIDAGSASRSQVARNFRSQGSHVRAVDLQAKGQPGFAAIDRNLEDVPVGQPENDSPVDFLDLLWVDSTSSQLILQTLEAQKMNQVTAGDIDGDFAIDLVIGEQSLQTIWGPPFDTARKTNFSPAQFDVLAVFNEGRPSASLGAERDGRLTVFRDGQWPALALVEPGECADPLDCHVRFAAGALGDERLFGWALAVVQTSHDGGLRVLRGIEGQADLGPAYDSASAPLVPLEAVNLSAPAASTSVFALDLGGALASDGTPIDEAVIIGRTEVGLEIAVVRPYLSLSASAELCGEPFTVEDLGSLALCFEFVTNFVIPGESRRLGTGTDPFIEIADADDDGFVDISWVTTNNSVMLLRGDGSGSLAPINLIELRLPEGDDDDDSSTEPGELPDLPNRLDWIRWTELDGTHGRELVGSDTLGGGLFWGINAGFESGLLDPRGVIALDPSDTLDVGYRGDFDGDGVDDIALADLVLFGQPVND